MMPGTYQAVDIANVITLVCVKQRQKVWMIPRLYPQERSSAVPVARANDSRVTEDGMDEESFTSPIVRHTSCAPFYHRIYFSIVFTL